MEPERTHIIRLSANIGRRKGLIAEDEVLAAIEPWSALPDRLTIDLTHLALSDDEPAAWRLLAAEIRRRVGAFVQEQVVRSDVPRICVFGLAPIPLLMVLGEAIGESTAVRAFNRLRDPDGWRWQADAPPRSAWQVVSHAVSPRARHVAVLLSVSGKVDPAEAEAALPGCQPLAMYEIAVEGPRTDVIRAEHQLREFARHYRELLARIRATHGPQCQIHLFPAVPVAIAVQCGLSLLPKSDPAIRVYDHQREAGGFVAALDLLAPPASPPPPQPARPPRKQVALILMACPIDQKPLELAREAAAIEEQLGLREARERFDVILGWSVTAEHVTDLIVDRSPTWLAFGGHGGSDGSLLVLGAGGTSKVFSSDALAALLGALRTPPRCVALNACFSGTAIHTWTDHVDVVIGMREAISDEAALQFSRGLHRAIARGKDLQESFETAKARLAQLDPREDHIPQINCRPGVDPRNIVF